MIPRTATRHLSVVLRLTEPAPAPDHRDRGTFLTPRLAAESRPSIPPPRTTRSYAACPRRSSRSGPTPPAS